MARYLLCYDGRWQESFEDVTRALAFGREVAEETGRLVHVVRRGLIVAKLLAVFPESRVEEGEWLWKIRWSGAGSGGGHSP
jgi:hypothetical protein